MTRPFYTLLLFLTGLLLPLFSSAEVNSFKLQTEAELTLSIAQEAEEAIDRAQRWLITQSPATNRIENLLQRYALTNPKEAPFQLYRCDITPLEYAMPPPEPMESYTNFTATVEHTIRSPKRLFALQRDIPRTNPPENWREILALALINSQKIAPTGGHWDAPSRENTLWAILTLRALLNESPTVQLVE